MYARLNTYSINTEICVEVRIAVSQPKQAKEDDFVASCNLLFDIAHHDVMSVIKIEEDKVFLTDLHSERKYVMGGVDTELAEKEKRTEARSQKEIQRCLREEDRKQKVRL